LPRKGNLGGKFFGKPRLILGSSADYDNDDKTYIKRILFIAETQTGNGSKQFVCSLVRCREGEVDPKGSSLLARHKQVGLVPHRLFVLIAQMMQI
jgi:hypothetical protein